MAETLDIDIDALFADMLAPEEQPAPIEAPTVECDYIDIERGTARRRSKGESQ
jgi:hypothetical protein